MQKVGIVDPDIDRLGAKLLENLFKKTIRLLVNWSAS
jgi:hypothetical protein